MLRNSIVPAVLILGASLLSAQTPTQKTGNTTNTPSGTGNTTGGSEKGAKTGKSASGTTTSTTGGGDTGTSSSGTASKKPAPGSLEDLIDKALKSNADIRAAEAKVREAEAELNRVRHQVVAKVATLKHDITTSKKMLDFAEKQAALVAETHRRGSGTQQELQLALAAVEKQKADLARLETEMQSLTGAWKNVIGSAAFSLEGSLLYMGHADGSVRIWDVGTGRAVANGEVLWAIDSASVQTPMAERIKSALDKNVKIDEPKIDITLSEALALVIKSAKSDVPFRPIGKLEGKPTILLINGDLPLGAWLQFLEDAADVRFVVRDYGILVTPSDRIPQGAITVQEFWKRGEKNKSNAPKGPGSSSSSP
jgi:hypothetical protein